MHRANSQQLRPQWLRFPDAQRYCGLGRSTLTGLIKTGELKAAKVGKSVRINRVSIDEYMERQVLSGGES